MPTDNLVSIKLEGTDLDEIKQAVETLNQKLKPLLITLTAQQRREVPKMGDGTVPFVSKAMEYALSNPEFAPPYMDVPEMEVDLEAVGSLNDVYRPLLQLMQQLDDSIMLSGSEAYVAALAYYNSVKTAARMNVANAKAIYTDLKQRFIKRNSGKSEEQLQEAEA
ncbi:hypothetical protein [Reichenbachiella sp.]|uniref:hypothetical protein n=1 Tax=Reichenbachiella sp. TaxID=2184521 RepID=UPI0032969145